MKTAIVLVALLFSCADAYWRNEGKQFQLNFPPAYNWGSSGSCQLSIAGRASGSVRVEAAFLLLNETRAITPFTRTVFNLAATSRPVGAGLDNEAVYIYSDVDIAVVAFNYVSSTGTSGGQRSAYLLFPVEAGDSYVIHSHGDAHNSVPPSGYFTVVATSDATDVTAYSPLAAGGYIFRESFTLNKGQCYNNISDYTEDISGVKLVASKPISVVSGHSNVKLSLETQWRTQTIGSAVFPVRALGRHYVVPGIAGGDPIQSEIRVIAVAPGDTWVTFNGANNVTIAEGKLTSLIRSDKTQATAVVCSQACSVAVYTYQDNVGNLAGSIQLPIVPETAFTSGGLVIITPDSIDTAINHYLSLVVEGTDTSGILLGGTTFNPGWTTVTVPGGLTYSVGTATIASGAYSLTTSGKRVAGYVYAHFIVDSSRAMSYGFPAGFDDIAYVTTPAPTTTTTSPNGTPPPSSDTRPAPGYEFILHGDFTSVNLSTGQLGDPFTTACINTYSAQLATRANNIGVTVNNKIGIDFCPYLAPEDMRIEMSNVRMGTNISDARYGAAEIDYITSSKNHLTFADTVDCADDLARYLQMHANWGQPILASEPGCPFVNFTRNFFDIVLYQWYCRDNTGQVNLPNYAIPLYSNYTSYSGEAVTSTCATAYSNQLERQAQDQVTTIDRQIGVSVCTNVTGVRLLRTSTIFATNTAVTGSALVTFYLSTTNSNMRYIDLMVCADEIGQVYGPLSQWGQPLLNQEPGCPLLQFQDPFVAQDKYWFCYT